MSDAPIYKQREREAKEYADEMMGGAVEELNSGLALVLILSTAIPLFAITDVANAFPWGAIMTSYTPFVAYFFYQSIRYRRWKEYFVTKEREIYSSDNVSINDVECRATRTKEPSYSHEAA